MKIEDGVCTKEQAERLKELGVKQHDNCFYWEIIFTVKNNKKTDHSIKLVDRRRYKGESGVEYYSAFLCGELGEMLKDKPMPYYSTSEKEWIVRLNDRRHYKTEAQARAGLFIFFIENKLVKSGR